MPSFARGGGAYAAERRAGRKCRSTEHTDLSTKRYHSSKHFLQVLPTTCGSERPAGIDTEQMSLSHYVYNDSVVYSDWPGVWIVSVRRCSLRRQRARVHGTGRHTSSRQRQPTDADRRSWTRQNTRPAVALRSDTTLWGPTLGRRSLWGRPLAAVDVRLDDEQVALDQVLRLSQHAITVLALVHVHCADQQHNRRQRLFTGKSS